MGSPFNLIFYASDSADAYSIAKRCFLLVDSLNSIFSDYDPKSELCKLSSSAGSGKFIPVSSLLYEIIKTSKEANEASNGAFDISVGTLSKLWRKARKEKRFASIDEVREAVLKTGNENIILNEFDKSIRLEKAGLKLDLGGIAKGFAAQQVIDFLKANGITKALADAGGDIVCSANPPGTKGWKVGINIPGEANELLPRSILLKNKSVATSGDAYQYFEYDGKKYSHIIDPGTGYGVTHRRNVTVIAKDGATADWLATACSILRVGKARRLARRYEADLLIGEVRNGKVRFYSTGGFDKYLRG